MLSIIICHRNKQLLADITLNVAATIGIPYELIVIDNTVNQYNIFTAYNEGVKRAKYDILCFTHEDIIFYSKGWGLNVLKHFSDMQVGMIGVTGSLVQVQIPSPWWYNVHFSGTASNQIIRRNDGGFFQYYRNPFVDNKRTEAIIIDGQWFCIRKLLFQQISFDDRTFSGFHLYDADISLQVQQYAKNFVIYDILLEHNWHGEISSDYYPALLLFIQKWNFKLPLTVHKISKEYIPKYNWFALRNVIGHMRIANVPKKIIEDICNVSFPIAKSYDYSGWFKKFFLFSKVVGYNNALRIFVRIEKMFKLLPDDNGIKIYKDLNKEELYHA